MNSIHLPSVTQGIYRFTFTRFSSSHIPLLLSRESAARDQHALCNRPVAFPSLFLFPTLYLSIHCTHIYSLLHFIHSNNATFPPLYISIYIRAPPFTPLSNFPPTAATFFKYAHGSKNPLSPYGLISSAQ